MQNSFRATIRDRFKEIDGYALPIRLNVEGKNSFKSTCGACTTLLVAIIILILFFSRVVNMVHHTNPQILRLDEFQNNPGHLKLSQDANFILAIGVTANSANVNMTNSSIVSFSSTYNQNFRQSDGTTKKYKSKIHWTPCQPYNFPESIFGHGVFELYSLAYTYCPQYINFTANDGKCPSMIKDEYPSCQTPPNFIIKGVYLSLDFEFIQFKFKECQSSDADHLTGLQCASNSTIVDTFNTSEIKVNAYFTNTLIDSLNYKTPNKTYLDSIYWTIDPSVSKLADVFMDQQIVQDYDSYIYDNKNQNSSFFSIDPNTMREIQVFQSSSMLELNMRRSTLNHVTKREYTKLLDVVSNIGGVAQAVFIIVGIALLHYVNYRYKMKLSNELYDFEPAEEQPKKPKKKQRESPKNSKRINQTAELGHVTFTLGENIIPPHNTTEASQTAGKFAGQVGVIKKLLSWRKAFDSAPKKQNKVKEYFDNLEKKKRRLHFSEWHYFKSIFNKIFFRKDSEETLAEKAREQITKDLDIIKIFEKLKEIDKLKNLLLNRHQREVFSFIEKPIISTKHEDPLNKEAVSSLVKLEKKQTHRKSQYNITREEYHSMQKYARLYSAYTHLVKESEGPNSRYNRKLIEMMGEDLLNIFRKVDKTMGKKIDPARFETTVKKLMEMNNVVVEEEDNGTLMDLEDLEVYKQTVE